MSRGPVDRLQEITNKPGGVVTGVVTLALALVVLAGGAWVLGRGPDGGRTTTSTTASEAADEDGSHEEHGASGDMMRGDPAEGDPAEESGATADLAISSCRQTLDRQREVLDAAQASLAQWRLHIRAMNDLVAGRITLEQATRFWDRTRVGAHRKVDHFQRTDRQLGRARGSCEVPGADLSKSARGVVTECLAATLKHAPRVAVARVAVDTWSHHVHDMEALRRGEITPEQAVAAWNRSWRQGVEQLRVYDERTAEAAPYDCG